MSRFKVFKEITMGGTSKEELLQQLAHAGVQTNLHAETLFAHPSFLPSSSMVTVGLVKTNLAELGLTDTCTFEAFESRATELGLKLCPLHLAAFLRLNYLDQPPGPYLTIASKPVEPDVNYPKGFYLRNFENTLWLRGYRADGFSGWPSPNEFVLMI